MKTDANALNKIQIEDWKREFGHVYKTIIDGEGYIWRKLKRSEYIDIMTETAEEEDAQRIYHRQEKIAKKVVLYPAGIDKIIDDSAGLATNIAEEVLGKSGFEIGETTEL